MKFTPQALGGLDFKTARQVLRYLRALDTTASMRGEPGADVDLDAFREHTGVEFQVLEPILLRQGFIRKVRERNEGSCYTLTDLGFQIAKASLLKRLSRQQIDELFEEVNSRITEVEEDDRFLYGFEFIAVFGSFLRQQPDYGDINFAALMSIKPKFKEWSASERSKHHLKYFPADYRDETPWILGRERAVQHLRGRRQRIELIQITDFVDLLKTNPALEYRVLIDHLK